MADHHPALPLVAFGVVGDAGDLPEAQLTLVMQVDIDAPVELGGQTEDQIELGDGIVVDATGVETADVFHAQLQRLAHQLGGAGSADQSGLREDHELHVDQVGVTLAQRLHGLDVTQAQLRIDIHMAAEGQRATGDALLQQRAGTLGDGRVDFAQDAAFVGDVVLQRRPGAVRTPWLTPEGLVQVAVAFDQRR
ncbi:hypothetical protein D3C81_1253580 [compost metagenome]